MSISQRSWQGCGHATVGLEGEDKTVGCGRRDGAGEGEWSPELGVDSGCFQKMSRSRLYPGPGYQGLGLSLSVKVP